MKKVLLFLSFIFIVINVSTFSQNKQLQKEKTISISEKDGLTY